MPDMNQQAMMAKALREGPPAGGGEMEADMPEGCCCPECPLKDKCMAAGGGPAPDMESGGGGMGGMPGMKGGAA